MVSDGLKLCVFTQCYNELVKGNLLRFFDNVERYADIIAVYDDCSTDGSEKIIDRRADVVVRGSENDHSKELAHKQELMDEVLRSHPDIDVFLWMDVDEILCRAGTNNIRDYAKKFLKTSFDGVSFHELNLWRSDCWRRVDDWYDKGWFVRLWRNKGAGSMLFQQGEGLHKVLYPSCVEKVFRCKDFSVIHYGYATVEQILYRFITRHDKVPFSTRFHALNEDGLLLERLPDDVFPEHIIIRRTAKPKPLRYTIKDGIPISFS